MRIHCGEGRTFRDHFRPGVDVDAADAEFADVVIEILRAVRVRAEGVGLGEDGRGNVGVLLLHALLHERFLAEFLQVFQFDF